MIQGNPILVSENLALPYLEISSDQDGFLYVEPPIWAENQNGVVGIGRKVSESEIKSTSELIATSEKQIREKMEGFALPKLLSTEHRLERIANEEMKKNTAYYFLPDYEPSYITLSYEYCNCPQSKEFSAVEMTKPNSQTIELADTFVMAYPNAIDYANDKNDKYTFIFYDNGFRITLFTQENLENGLLLVKELKDFWK